jgi:hypothetical protein
MSVLGCTRGEIGIGGRDHRPSPRQAHGHIRACRVASDDGCYIVDLGRESSREL